MNSSYLRCSRRTWQTSWHRKHSMHLRNSCTRSTSACLTRHVPSAASGDLPEADLWGVDLCSSTCRVFLGQTGGLPVPPAGGPLATQKREMSYDASVR